MNLPPIIDSFAGMRFERLMKEHSLMGFYKNAP